jgi:hypothetical protein
MADVTDQIAQTRTLIEVFLRLNPTADDKASVDEKLAKCQGIYEAENIVDLPLITHVGSRICYDELIQKLTQMIAKYRGPVIVPAAAGFPWWGYVAIGGGALLGLGLLVALFVPKSPIVITKGKAA